MIWMTADLPADSRDGIFKVLQGKTEQTSILYPVKLSFKIEGKKKKKKKTFADENRDFVSSQPN